MSQIDVIDKLCTEAGGQFGWETPDCVDNLTNNRSIEMDTRYNWKFAAYNSVSGTPVVLVNGVQHPSFPTTAGEWFRILKDSLRDEPKSFSH